MASERVRWGGGHVEKKYPSRKTDLRRIYSPSVMDSGLLALGVGTRSHGRGPDEEEGAPM